MMTPTTTIRVSRKTRAILQEMSQESGLSMIQLIEAAVQAYQDRQFLEAVNAAYAALREDPKAWAELLEERAEWDVTLQDGLEGL
jgi:hypothetical protein